MDLAENLLNELVEQAQLCVGPNDIETAVELKIKIGQVIQVLAQPNRTRADLGLIGRLLRLEVNPIGFLAKELREELKELLESRSREDSPDR